MYLHKKTDLTIPHRWNITANTSTELLENFIFSKCPLNIKYNKLLNSNETFAIYNLVTYIKQTYSKKIGLVIDLTNTTKYYDKLEITSKGIKYHKISCTGYNQSPSDDEVNNFINIVNNFREINKDDIIVVHCTHGHNRTGFLVCAYLTKVLNYKIDNAIEQFAKVRSPGIYKQEYIKELLKKYN